ncbi:DUF2283 domain-containing protein [bacterium]|nr:DUF2283 domain-containing protein [bacterium]MBU1651861.1 DUF2283 domain-containing protein [bacterium]
MDKLKIWYDPEGDFLEISVSDIKGEFRSSSNRNVLIKTDRRGSIVGFAVLNVSKVENEPLDLQVSLKELQQMIGVPQAEIS